MSLYDAFQKVSSFFYSPIHHPEAGRDPAAKTWYGHRLTRIAGGIGLAGLALLSWKILAAGALGYSAYQGGRFITNRIAQRFSKNLSSSGAASNPGADEESDIPERVIAPISHGHESHGQRQNEPREPFAALQGAARIRPNAAPQPPAVPQAVVQPQAPIQPEEAAPSAQVVIKSPTKLSLVWNAVTQNYHSEKLTPRKKIFNITALLISILLKRGSYLFKWIGRHVFKMDLSHEIGINQGYFTAGKAIGFIPSCAIALFALPYLIYRWKQTPAPPQVVLPLKDSEEDLARKRAERQAQFRADQERMRKDRLRRQQAG